MLRRIIIIVAALAVLAGLIVVGGTLILRSEWLAQQVLARASGQLGLEVDAESFSLGWGGGATLREVSVRMPLSDEVVFAAERLELELGAVPLLVLGLRVRSVTLDEPRVFLQQFENGRWNVQDVWARIQASLRPSRPGGRRIRLPEVTIRDATIHVTAADETTQTIGPITFDGRRQGRVLWGFDLRAPPMATIEGRVSESADWAHEVQFAVQDIGSLVRVVAGQEPAPIQLAGRWRGTVRQAILAGRIDFDELTVGRAAVQGAVAVEAASHHITLRPRGLRVAGILPARVEPDAQRRSAPRPPSNRGPEALDTRGDTIALTDGAVRISPERIAVEFLSAQAGAFGSRMSGTWEFQARRGEFSGSWVGAWPAEPVTGGPGPGAGGTDHGSRITRHEVTGTYGFSVRSPRAGRREAQANVTAQARTPVGSWRFVADARGEGADWQTSEWQIQVPAFSWSDGERQVNLTEVAARIGLRWPEIQLVSLSMPEAKRVQAEARFDARTGRWSAQLAVEQLPRPLLGAQGFDLGLSVEGDQEQARVRELRVAVNETVLTAKGDVSFIDGGLQNVRLQADWLAHDPRSGPARVPQPPGRWRLEANVTGQVQPLVLEAQATLAGQHIALGKRWVDQVQVPVHARMDARQVDAVTPPFDLLGGQWQMAGRYELSGRMTQVHLMADDLSLEAIASLAGVTGDSWPGAHVAGASARGAEGVWPSVRRPEALDARGQDVRDTTGRGPRVTNHGPRTQGLARGEIKLRMPGFDLERAVATGSWSAEDVNLPPLAARRAEGALRVASGSVRLGHIRLEQDSGLIRADVDFRLEEPEVVSIELAAQRWPLQLEDPALRLVVDGRTRLRVNLLERTGDGEARLAGRIRWQERELADLRLGALMQGQILDVSELHAELLGGSVDGTARISLHRWVDSVAQLRWQGIQPRQLQAWLAPFERLEGTMSGSLVVEQARGTGDSWSVARVAGASTRGAEGVSPSVRGPEALDTRRQDVRDTMGHGSRDPARPLGPMRFALEADVAEGRFGPAQIGPSRMVGYLDPNRLLVQDASFDVVGGRVDARARVSRRDGRFYGSVVTDFNDLNLDQLVHALDPNAGVYVGRLSGSATVLPVFNDGLSLSGEGRIEVSQSDLVGSRVVRTLYDTLNLRFGPQEPTGTGEVRLQFQGPAIVLSSVQYFNRGVEIRGAGEIQNVNLGVDSPMEGYAVASTRILAGIRLPAIGALDRILGAFQTDAASVRIGGTLGDTEVGVVPLPEILGPFRRLLWAQLRE